jgi:sigma-E factor negative regulatory protein RseC
MIEETAVITDKKDQYVTFEVERSTACGICGQTRGCGNATWGKLLGHKQQFSQAENLINANVGDQVVIGVEEKVVLNAALWLYFIPLFALFVGAGLGQILFNQELYVIIGSVIGLLSGLLIVKQVVNQIGFFSRYLRVNLNQSSAVVLRFLHESADTNNS